jgi:hypothetical protein
VLIHISLGIASAALLYALFAHLRRNRRVSCGFVLAAAMLALQAIFHPPAEQVIAQQTDEEDEQDSELSELSLEEQILFQAKRIRSGRQKTGLKLRLPARRNDGSLSIEDRGK